MAWALLLTLVAYGARLEGSVVDPEGAPAAGALVLAWGENAQVRFADVGPEGTFLLELPAGRYRLRALPPSGTDWVEAVLGGGFTWCGGEPLVLRPDQRREVGRLVLGRGGRLTGTLLTPEGAPAAEALVTVEWSEEPDLEPLSAFVEESGSFSIGGLPLGVGFQVRISGDGLATQYLPSSYDPGAAPRWELSSAEGLDLGEIRLLPAAAAAGRVLGAGQPLGQAIVWLGAGGTWQWQLTDDEGNWSANGLTPGEMSLRAEAPGFATTWWGGTSSAGPSVLLQAGEERSGLELDLAPEVRFSGTVSGLDATEGLVVIAQSVEEGSAQLTLTDERGAFEVGGLPPGRYTLEVRAGDAGGFDQRWRGEQPDGTFLVEAPGRIEVGDLVLLPGASVEGTMTPGSGEPLGSPLVYAERTTDGAWRYTSVGPAGRYVLSGLEPGTWRLWIEHRPACPGDPSWVPVYYPAEVHPLRAGALRVAAAETGSWSVELPPDADRDAMGDPWEAQYGLDSTEFDANRDPDRDGFSNLEEYRLGTDPRLAVSPGCGHVGRSANLGLWALAFGAHLGRRRRFRP